MPDKKNETNSRPAPSRFSTFAVAIILGLVAGLAAYQARTQGLLNFKNTGSLPPLTPQLNQRVTNQESAVEDVADKSSPSVVAISATSRIFNPYNPFAPSQSQTGTIGTGFVVSDKGIIVTNRHVVDDASASYNVVDRDGKKYEITKIYRDPVLDLAIVQVNGSDLKPLELGDSSKLRVGQSVVAIGNALGRFTNTVTTGVVSGLGRHVVAGDPFGSVTESLDDLIQTDAAVNPGNSGGPLLNLSGQVIGVNVATTEGAQNIGFAIPINSVKKIVAEFGKTGTVSRPFLGVSYTFVSKDDASLYNLVTGAYVQKVITGSGADKAGLKRGDIITKIDNQVIDAEGKVSSIIVSKKVGDTLNITVWSNGSEKTVSATLSQNPNQ